MAFEGRPLLCNDLTEIHLMPGAAPEPGPVAYRLPSSTSASGFSCHAAGAVRFLRMAKTEHLSDFLARAILPRHSQGMPCFHRLVVAGRWIFVSRC